MNERLPSKQVVLLGIGHTNAHVLRMWGMNRFPDADLTCISDFPVATYSGMLPAVLAGQNPREGMEIDLVRLCASVGARLITNPVVGVDHEKQEVLFDDRPAVAFDVLSIGIGSVPTTEGLQSGREQVIKIKPMQTFLNRLRDRITKAVSAGPSPLSVVVVGGGVASVEISFCISPFIRSVTDRDYTVALVTRSDKVLPEVTDATRQRVMTGLQSQNVSVTTDRSVIAVDSGKATLDDGTMVPADLVIWATGAVAPDALHRFDLPLDERGFIATHPTLQSVSGHPVFAVGDTGSIVKDTLPKAGVYAVRQGPVLWDNLERTLRGQPLKTYQPQRSFLKLINQGDGSAIGQWRGWSFSGEWAMRWKDRIDTRFMKMFRPAPMMGDDDEQPMQCTGCGCKLGGDLLESALASDPHAAIKLEDAAEIGDDPDSPLIASTDFFTRPLTDAFLSGRVAALHSASDIIATGARVTQALANVVVPEGDGKAQKRLLSDFLSGARLEFDAMGAAIVGGHTIVGPRMEIGFTVIGKPLSSTLIRKENLKPGDQLWLTKPIGIGILLAAHMRSLCRAEHYQALVDAMLLRQHDLASVAVEVGLNAGTDVTGFGLAGHLLEMLETSDVAAELNLDQVPLLPGTVEYVKQGVESSLAPDNKRVLSKIQRSEAIDTLARFHILFDPQTCGGLLLGVAAEHSERFQHAMAEARQPQPAMIGTVAAAKPDAPRLIVQ